MELISDGLRLAAHLARPSGADLGSRPRPGLLVLHGFPDDAQGADSVWATFPELADRLAAETSVSCLTVALRGCATSEGDFSLDGWLRDAGVALGALLAEPGVAGAWACGFDLGGSLAVCLAATDRRVQGVAAFAAPADCDEWAADPRRFLERCRALGVVKDPAFPEDLDRWGRELREVRPLRLVHRVPPRPLLVVHGTQDDVVPLVDARALVDAAEGHADLRVISAAGHSLRHDPRAFAILLGWLDRQMLPVDEESSLADP